jgi:hypothetical protein
MHVVNHALDANAVFPGAALAFFLHFLAAVDRGD